MNVRIQPATKEHLPAIMELWKEFIDFHAEMEPVFKRKPGGHVVFGEFVEKLIDADDGLLLVALDGEEVVGHLLAREKLYPTAFEVACCGEIIDLAVRLDVRGGGIGHALVTEAFGWFESKNISRIEINVVTKNASAQKFWRSIGFGDFMQTLVREAGR